MTLFCPLGGEPAFYTRKIVHHFEHYRVQLQAAQSQLTEPPMLWGEPVKPGFHVPGTLDVMVARKGDMWNTSAQCEGCGHLQVSQASAVLC